jgi:hypothetical protein
MLLFGVLLLSGALAAYPANAATESCQADALCSLTGRIMVISGGSESVGVIDTPNGCVAAALPQPIYRNYRHWNGKTVTITGTAYLQPEFPMGVISYQVRDRMVATGACSSKIVIYVDKIKLVR